MKSTAFISLGSNLENKKNNLFKAINYLKSNIDIKIHKISSVYITEPKYYTKQEDFYNLVLCLKTNLSPLDLLYLTQSIEKKMGRKIILKKNRPRIIDIDILTYDDINIQLSNLILPHPFIKERRFVLEPFNDIEPNFSLPDSKKTINQLLNVLKDSSKVIKLQL